jgi:GNAT superfamily N-acetyltransferase
VAEEVVTFLEMTSSDQLVPASRPTATLVLEEVTPGAAPTVRATYVRIGAPLSWLGLGRMGWSDEDWKDELSRPGVRSWVACVDGDIAGIVELEAGKEGDGLAPQFIGQGLGGWFLTMVTRLAWTEMSQASSPTRRVWVQTSSRDHPHALPNYERRGFRPYRRERRP